MDEYNKSSHTVYDVKYHMIWVTKYRYKVLNKNIAIMLRELISQGCETRGITIVQGSIGKDHVHLLIACTPSIAPSKIVHLLYRKQLAEVAMDNVVDKNHIEKLAEFKNTKIFID